MKKILRFLFSVLLYALPLFCSAQTNLSLVADSLLTIRQPRKAIEVYRKIAAENPLEKEPMQHLSALLNICYLQNANGFVPIEATAATLDSLKHTTQMPYDVVVAVAEAEFYAKLSRSVYGVERIAHCDSVPLNEWSSVNYFERVSSIIAQIMEKSGELSLRDGSIYLPQLTYNDVPGIHYSALEVVAARVYTFLTWFRGTIYQKQREIETMKLQMVDTLKKYGCDQTLLLFKLRDLDSGNEDEFKKLLKESEGSAMHYAVKRSYAVFLYSKKRYDEMMNIYKSDQRFAEDAIMSNLAEVAEIGDLSFDKDAFREPFPNKSWSCRINSRNIKKIDFTLYRIPDPVSVTYYSGYADIVDGFEKNLKIVKSWSQKIKGNHCYDSKVTDVNMPALPVGYYGVKASVEGEIDPSWLFFDVSTMTCVSIGAYITVMDRISGEPVVGAEAAFYYENKPGVQRRYMTDVNGGFSYQEIALQRDSDESDYYCTITRGEETKMILTNSFHWDYPIREAHENEEVVQFFFDKPIYKPGDTVKYKIICFNRKMLNAKLIANENIEVTIRNGAKTTTFRKMTDNYGAVEGNYLISKNFSQERLEFSVFFHSASVKVDEYKTPQMEIIIEKEYTQISSDTIVVRGYVQTMNGYDVEGAVVVYQLEEKKGNEKIVTDVNGKFSIKIGLSEMGYYYNSLSLTATSPSGHHAVLEERIYYRAGNHISIVCPDVLEIGEREKYPNVMILDGNRKEVISPIILKIYEGDAPLDLLNGNRWRDWEIDKDDKLVYEKWFDCTASANQALQVFPFKAGGYKIACTLPNDSTSLDVVALSFLSKMSKVAANKKGLYLYSAKKEFQDGDVLDLILGGKVENLKVYVYKVMVDRATLFTTCTLNSSQEILKIPFVESDGKNVKIVVVGVKNGEEYFVSDNFSGNNAADLLTVEMLSFRDKIKVGERERWQLRVKDSQGRGVKAQLLVKMYNAALDNIYKEWDYGFDFRYKRNDINIFPFQIFLEKGAYTNKRKYLENEFRPHSLFSLYTPFSFEYDKNLFVKRPHQLFGYIEGLRRMSFTGSSTTLLSNRTAHDTAPPKAEKTKNQIRTDFNDSALFLATKESDENGMVEIDFIAPQNITSWNVTILAHTKDVKAGETKFNVSTYKHLMVSINKPRFMREGDKVLLSARIDNITEQDMECDAEIQINDQFLEKKRVKILAGGHQTVSWMVTPKDVKDFFYCTITASNGTHSDGERIEVPYLSNKALITETASVVVDKGERKSLKINIPAKGRENHLVKLEVIKNPLWLVLENLPVLNNRLELINTTIFNGAYANVIASHLKNEMPQEIQKMLSDKKNHIREGGGVLDMNEEIKQITIENSPWLVYPVIDRENYERLTRFYEGENLDQYISDDFRVLFANQKSNGSFSWIMDYDLFDRYTSQHIAIGFGRLYTMGALNRETFEYRDNVKKLITYLDVQFKKSISKGSLNVFDIHHLYMRSMHKNLPYENHNDLLMKCWTEQPLYLQVLIGMTFHNSGYEEGARIILASLKDRAMVGKNGERYWESHWNSYWYARPFETHASIIEFFHAMGEDVEDIRKFMILNKKANSWGYSTATVDACYSLLVGMEKELKCDGEVKVKIAGRELKNESNYFTEIFRGEEITPLLNNITVESHSTTAIASVFYQYLEQTDRVKRSGHGISVERRLIAGDSIQLGDKIKVRMVVTAESDMEYVQLRDNRSMALEPVEPVSCYLFNGKIGCRMMVRNCSTDFFITYLPKGTHIIDYDVIVTYKGDVTAGFSEIQSLYAPEMKAVSEGERINVY